MVKDEVVARMTVKKITQKKLLMIFILNDRLLRKDIQTPLVCCIKNFLIYEYIYLIIVRRYW